ncbi:hypothetical protein [Lacticigenium naphthae]|uniref:baeRF6 domain-containing protein n=1 Tax=Lacticigenium naphthae TaxID=515351 RepID=UPI000400839B|nr:hypothetical protein [Lacticigenium naphthae]
MRELMTFPTNELLEEHEVVVSITQLIESTPFEIDKKQIQFQNLVKEVKSELTKNYSEEVMKKIMDQLKPFMENHDGFWRSVSGSLAFYATPKELYYYRLSVPVANYATVSKKPLVLPLIENFQFISDYHLLCLNHDHIKLFRGRQTKIEEIELPEEAPTTIDIALGDNEFTGGELNVDSYNGGPIGGMHHGHNEKSHEVQIDQVNYFRAVDKYILENFTKKEGLPLLVFGLPENLADFYRLSKNPDLSEEKIEASPAQLSNNEIEEKTAKIVKETIDKRFNAMRNQFTETTPEFKLGAQYGDLAFSSVEGKIDYLLLEKGYEVKGYIDENGRYHEGSEDLYVNQLAQNVLGAKGKVYVLDNERMPASEGLAAVLRY